MRLWDGLLDLLYPPKCVFCRRLLQREETEVCAALPQDVAENGGGSQAQRDFLHGGFLL